MAAADLSVRDRPPDTGVLTSSPDLQRLRSDARRALQLARDESRHLGHGFLGVGHLLLGLIAECGTAAGVLNDAGVEAADVRHHLVAIEGYDRPMPHARPGLTGECARSLDFAVAEAGRAGHRFVGTGHLVAGLVREGSVHALLPRIDLERLGGAALSAARVADRDPSSRPADHLERLPRDVRIRVEREVQRGAPEARRRFLDAARHLPGREAEEAALAELVGAWERATREFHARLAAMTVEEVAAMRPRDLADLFTGVVEESIAPLEELLARYGLGSAG